MTDRYIDQDETKIYGDYTARMIRKMAVGLLPAFDAGMEHLAVEITDATAAVKAAVDSARAADAKLRQGSQVKVSALAQAIELLGRFSRHLDGHARGSVDRKTFFTADGTAGGVGRSAARVLLALGHISAKLGVDGTPVSDAANWRSEFSRAAAQLAPVVDHSHDARTDRSQATPEVEAARVAWLQIYTAARSGVECVLRLTGRLNQLPLIFYDLAVPADAQVTEAPPEPDVPSPAPPVTA